MAPHGSHAEHPALAEATPAQANRLAEIGRERGRRRRAAPKGLGAAGLVAPAGLAAPAAPRWAGLADSPCHHHLGVDFAPDTFTLTGAVMRRLCELNSFPVPAAPARVLFGLRACKIITAPPSGPHGWTEFEASVDLAEDVPDHQDWHCVMGVWDTATDRVGVVRASTVPNRHYMKTCVEGGDRANLLPTGCYRYDVGTHRKIKGCFVDIEPFPVLRSFDDLCYTRTDTWDLGATPGDNLHCTAGGESGTKYSSAGCQVVGGFVDNGRHRGFFAQFRGLAGLPPQAVDTPGRFPYVLLTGRDARLVAQTGGPDTMRRLRFGSEGPRVRALAEALRARGVAAPLRSRMDDGLRSALIRWQLDRNHTLGQGRAADDVLTPDEAAFLGV